MARLQIHLLQDMTVLCNGGPPLDLGSPTTKSLFAYLVLNRDRAIDRRRLAFVLWPRSTESAARRNLRQYIHRLRRALEPVDPEGKLISTEGNSVQFCPPVDWILDVVAFEAAAHSDETLEEAVELYTGDLLPEVYDDWIGPERVRLALLFRQTLLRLVEKLESDGQLSTAISYAERCLEQEPLLESTYLRLMRLYYAVGDRARVKETYQRLVTTFDEELGAEPLAETTASLGISLELTPSCCAISSGVPNQPPPRRAIEPGLVGRDDDLGWLDRALAEAAAARGGVCLVHGESGIGKTRLVTEWMNALQGPVHLFSGRSHEFESMLSYASGGCVIQARHRASWNYCAAAAWLASTATAARSQRAFSLGQSAWPPGYHASGLGSFLMALAHRHPVILILDNLHWADLPSWSFLAYFAQYAVQNRILIVITARLEDTPPEAVRLIHALQERGLLRDRKLQRLSKEDTQTLLCDLMQDDDLDPPSPASTKKRRAIRSSLSRRSGRCAKRVATGPRACPPTRWDTGLPSLFRCVFRR
jgi:DNA-binding SARP family transcriptional activator